MSKTELQAISVQSEPHFKHCWFRFWHYERSGVHDICSVHISIITVFTIDSMLSLKSCIHFLNNGNKCSYFYNLYSTCFTSVKKKKKKASQQAEVLVMAFILFSLSTGKSKIHKRHFWYLRNPSIAYNKTKWVEWFWYKSARHLDARGHQYLILKKKKKKPFIFQNLCLRVPI